MTVDKLATFVASFDSDVIPISDLVRLVQFKTGELPTEILRVVYCGAFRAGHQHLFKGKALMNPFTLLTQQLRDKRSGNAAAEALSLLAPHWAETHVDEGQLPRTAILDRLDQCPDGKLVRQMKSLIQSLKGLN